MTAPHQRITSLPQIEFELDFSRQNNTVIGFTLKGDDDLITTAVVRVDAGPGLDKTVHLQSCDLHGYELDKNPILLSDIESIVPFTTAFDDPVYARIRKMKLHGGVAV